MNELAKGTCIPCKGGVPPLKGEELEALLEKLGNGWKIIKEHHLEKEYLFGNFREALDFTNKVGEMAEDQGHHPDIYLAWGKVRLTIWTHKIDAVSSMSYWTVFFLEFKLGPRGENFILFVIFIIWKKMP